MERNRGLVRLPRNTWVPVTYHFLPCESQPNVKDQQSLYTVWQPVPYFSFLCLQPDVLMVTVSRLEITRDRSRLYRFSPVHDALKSLGLVTAGPLSFPYHKTHKDRGRRGRNLRQNIARARYNSLGTFSFRSFFFFLALC